MANRSRRRRLEDVPDRVILRTLAESGGVIAEAARILIAEGVVTSRSTLSRYISGRPELHNALGEIVEGTVDYAEKKLLAQIERDDGPAIRFMLATRGRSRGWGKTVEVTAPAEPDKQESPLDYSLLGNDELRLLCALTHRAMGKKDVNDDDFVRRGILPTHKNDSAEGKTNGQAGC